MNLKAIIFDLDGTLIYFQIEYQPARKKIISILEKNGYPKDTLSTSSFIFDILKEANNYYKEKLNYSLKKINKISTKINKYVTKIEYKASKKAIAIQGIHQILSYIQSMNIRTGIMTLNTTRNALISLQKAKLQLFFPIKEFIIGRDLVVKTKPNIAHIQKILTRMQLKAEEICVIGDHPTDIEVANKIGALSIAITTKKHIASDFGTEYTVPQSNPEKKMIKILKSFLEINND